MQETAKLEIGQAAPEFSLRGPGGQLVTLSEYRGQKNVVLVFYPLAFSPVCSHQLPAIQKELAAFEALDAVVLGVSVDSHYANTAFARSLGLSFALLSDWKRAASTAYGVLNTARGYSGRAIFVVDRQGNLAYVDVSPTPDLVPSNAAVLDALSRLRS
jgi:peroxiredoxin (alkyl hydroperoxide reductase subunit C)